MTVSSNEKGSVFVSDGLADYFHIPRNDLRKHFGLPFVTDDAHPSEIEPCEPSGTPCDHTTKPHSTTARIVEMGATCPLCGYQNQKEDQ